MKKIKAEDIVEIIGDHAIIGIGNACGEPQTLIDTLIENNHSFKALEIYGMIHYWTQRFVQHHLGERFTLKLFMVDRFTLDGLQKGYTQYIPCRYSDIPGLFLNGRIRLDVALISLTPPNARGYCSLGVSSDFTMSMALTAGTVIAEINHQMPWVYGNNVISIQDVDYFLETDRPLPQVYLEGSTERDRLIGGLLSDGIVDLVKKGVIDNSHKGLKNGKIVTTTMIGTDKLYTFVHKNKSVEAYPADYTHNQVTLAKLNKLHAINSAIQVDLTGQINAETVEGIQVSGVGGQSDFVCGASLSKGGKSIIVIPSSSTNGEKSRIVPWLGRGESITSLRHDIDYVVTEYGAAHLRGKTMRERAHALIDIANPKFRDWLESERSRLYP
jgi:4-hydroxybutyrate CoA-transferase